MISGQFSLREAIYRAVLSTRSDQHRPGTRSILQHMSSLHYYVADDENYLVAGDPGADQWKLHCLITPDGQVWLPLLGERSESYESGLKQVVQEVWEQLKKEGYVEES